MAQHYPIDYPKVREVDQELFTQFAGPDAAYAVVKKASGEDEIVIPKGREWMQVTFPETEITALYSLRATSHYTKCVNGKRWCCYRNICVYCGTC